MPSRAGCPLAFHVLPDDAQRSAAAGRGEVRRGPQVLPLPDTPLQLGEVPPDEPRRHTFEAVDQAGQFNGRRVLDQQVHVVVFAVAFHEDGAEVGADLPEGAPQVIDVGGGEHSAPVFGHEYQVDMQGGNARPAAPVILSSNMLPSVDQL